MWAGGRTKGAFLSMMEITQRYFTPRVWSLILAAALNACGPAADSGGVPGAATETPSPETTAKTAIFVAAGTAAPECTSVLAKQIAYFESEAAFKYCTGIAWQIVDLRGPKGDPGPSGSSPILISSTPEPAGTNCFYSGEKYSLGPDTDSSGALDADEISGFFYHCESSIAKTANDLMATYVHSIGLIKAIYRITGNCYSFNDTHELTATGTAWAYSGDTFVTNAHVAEPYIKEDCNFDGTDDTVFPLTEIKVYLPKTSITADTWMTRGARYSPTDPSQTEYDAFSVTQLDRRASTATSPVNPTDIADAMFLKVPGHGRTPLPVSSASQDNPTSQSVRIGENLVMIAHPAGRSTTMSTGTMMSIQTCSEWWLTDNSLFSLLSSKTEFCKTFHNVPESRRLIVSNYSEHGSSGGPVLNRFGEVIGVETWGSIAYEESDYSAVQQIAYVRPWLLMTREWSSVLSYVAWQNVTVTDSSYRQTLTGKEWTKIHGYNTWANAINLCGDPTNKWGTGVKTGTINAYPGYNGKMDWRMPSIGELQTAYSGVLVVQENSSYSSVTQPLSPMTSSDSIKSITNTSFLNSSSWSNYFWSGASVSGSSTSAYDVSLFSGYTSPSTKTSSSISQVICVRGP
jgi:hypothetical protein